MIKLFNTTPFSRQNYYKVNFTKITKVEHLVAILMASYNQVEISEDKINEFPILKEIIEEEL
jgi:hypothetical protein